MKIEEIKLGETYLYSDSWILWPVRVTAIRNKTISLVDMRTNSGIPGFERAQPSQLIPMSETVYAEWRTLDTQLSLAKTAMSKFLAALRKS